MCGPTNQCTRIAKQRLIETGWACDSALVLQMVLLARNRVISSVGRDAAHLAYQHGGHHPLASLRLADARLRLSSGWGRLASGS
jgi:hypothetical protein